MTRGLASKSGWLFYGGRILDARRASARTGRILDARRSSEAVLVRGGRIEAMGPLAAMKRAGGRGVQPVDLKGGTLSPGFVDSHIHLITWIRALRSVWLREQTVEDLERAVHAAERSGREGEWIAVRGWVPREWPRELTTRAVLDHVSPRRPLILHAVDGHSVWANGPALAIAGVVASTANPPGGIVEKDANGEPTGILIEEAASLVRRAAPHVDDPTRELRDAIGMARSLGITSAHDYDRSGIRPAAQVLEARGDLGFRLLVSLPVDQLEAAETLEFRSGWGSERLRLGPVKIFADGTLGSSTALLEEPYEGTTDRGIEVTPPDVLHDRFARAAKAGLSVAVHAIGDRAVRNVLDAIETLQRHGRAFAFSPRIEHVQLAREADFARFRRLGVVASVQPIHQVTDREQARRRWGSRTTRSYAWRSLLRAGARVMFGSDAPFDAAGPLLALQAAMLRRRGDEPSEAAFHAEQRLTLSQALRAHVEEPHRSAGWGIPLGRIEPGYGADLVHFDQDLLRVPPEELHKARILGVWVEGARVHGN